MREHAIQTGTIRPFSALRTEAGHAYEVHNAPYVGVQLAYELAVLLGGTLLECSELAVRSVDAEKPYQLPAVRSSSLNVN